MFKYSIYSIGLKYYHTKILIMLIISNILFYSRKSELTFSSVVCLTYLFTYPISLIIRRRSLVPRHIYNTSLLPHNTLKMLVKFNNLKHPKIKCVYLEF